MMEIWLEFYRQPKKGLLALVALLMWGSPLLALFLISDADKLEPLFSWGPLNFEITRLPGVKLSVAILCATILYQYILYKAVVPVGHGSYSGPLAVDAVPFASYTVIDWLHARAASPWQDGLKPLVFGALLWVAPATGPLFLWRFQQFLNDEKSNWSFFAIYCACAAVQIVFCWRVVHCFRHRFLSNWPWIGLAIGLGGAALAGVAAYTLWPAKLEEGTPCEEIDAGIALDSVTIAAGGEFIKARLAKTRINKLTADGVHFEGADLRCSSLPSADLKGAYLQGANLTRADLSGATLVGADLTGAIMIRTRLYDAKICLPGSGDKPQEGPCDTKLAGVDLTDVEKKLAGATTIPFDGFPLGGIDLTGATLNKANLKKAYLRGAKLGEAKLHAAELGGADLTGADLAKAELDGADLTDAILGDVTLAGGTIKATKWAGSKLHGARLTGVTFLAETNLSKAEFNDARLTGVTFLAKADLSMAKFVDATLTDAIMDGINLSGSDFSGAILKNGTWGTAVASGTSPGPTTTAAPRTDLRWAKFNGASIDGTDFTNARLDHAHFKCVGGTPPQCAKLTGANFTGAVLERGDFNGATLDGVTWTNANLAHADFTGANLVNIDFSGANIPHGTFGLGTNLAGAILDGATLTEIKLVPKVLNGVKSLAGTKLVDVVLSDQDLSGKNMKGAILTGATVRWSQLPKDKLVGATMHGIKFADADLNYFNMPGGKLDGANFTGKLMRWAKFPNAELTHADFTNAKPVDADFTGAILADAKFTNADLQRADFAGADMKGADLTGAYLCGAKLKAAVNLTAAQVGLARINKTTQLPPALAGLTRSPPGRCP